MAEEAKVFFRRGTYKGKEQSGAVAISAARNGSGFFVAINAPGKQGGFMLFDDLAAIGTFADAVAGALREFRNGA